MSKNIVLCLDGTGNQLKAKGNTNVVRLFELLDLSLDPPAILASIRELAHESTL